MRSMSMLQLLGGVAVAGVVAAGTTALTGSGVVWGTTPGTGAGATQFVGGTLQQTVAGATIADVQYTVDTTGTQTSRVTITVNGADGQFLTVTPAGGGYSSTGNTPPDAANANQWKCSGDVVAPVAGAAPHVHLNNDPAIVTCDVAQAGTVQGFYRGLSTVDMAIATS